MRHRLSAFVVAPTSYPCLHHVVVGLPQESLPHKANGVMHAVKQLYAVLHASIDALHRADSLIVHPECKSPLEIRTALML